MLLKVRILLAGSLEDLLQLLQRHMTVLQWQHNTAQIDKGLWWSHAASFTCCTVDRWRPRQQLSDGCAFNTTEGGLAGCLAEC